MQRRNKDNLVKQNVQRDRWFRLEREQSCTFGFINNQRCTIVHYWNQNRNKIINEGLKMLFSLLYKDGNVQTFVIL